MVQKDVCVHDEVDLDVRYRTLQYGGVHASVQIPSKDPVAGAHRHLNVFVDDLPDMRHGRIEEGVIVTLLVCVPGESAQRRGRPEKRRRRLYRPSPTADVMPPWDFAVCEAV